MARRPDAVPKGPDAFRTISEAASDVGVPAHVLRFWETKFDAVQPVKRAGGRRFYRPSDIETLKSIRARLHDDGMTIKGVQRLMARPGRSAVPAAQDDHAATSGPRDDRVAGVLARIEAAREDLRTVLIA